MATTKNFSDNAVDNTLMGRFLVRMENASDYVSAIAVKEVRQSLKSRSFIGMFMLMLAGAWLISMFKLITHGENLNDAPVGREIFGWFFGILYLTCAFIVPIGCFRSLASEREQQTYDLLNITALSPRQIVWGKLLSSLAQVFILYSAITPFIAFASLLQGFDAPTAAFLLIWLIIVSMLSCMFTLMCSSLAKTKMSQGLILMGVILFLFMMFSYSMTAAAAITLFGNFGGQLPLTEPLFWWVNAITLLTVVSYFALFQQIAVSQLTFESNNRSTGLRLVFAGQFWAMWIIAFAFSMVQKVNLEPEVVQSLVAASVSHWLLASLIFSTEADHLSRRVRRGIPSNAIWRIFAVPFLPGGARGLILCLFHLAVIPLLVLLSERLLQFGPTGTLVSTGGGGDALTAVYLYAALYMGVMCAISRWMMRATPQIRPMHARVISIIVIVGSMIIPLIPMIFAPPNRRGQIDSILNVFNPVLALSEIAINPNSKLLTLLLVGAVISVSVNLLAMYRGAVAILTSPVRSKVPPVSRLPDAAETGSHIPMRH